MEKRLRKLEKVREDVERWRKSSNTSGAMSEAPRLRDPLIFAICCTSLYLFLYFLHFHYLLTVCLLRVTAFWESSRELEKVREGWRSLEKVGERWCRLGKVGEGRGS